MQLEMLSCAGLGKVTLLSPCFFISRNKLPCSYSLFFLFLFRRLLEFFLFFSVTAGIFSFFFLGVLWKDGECWVGVHSSLQGQVRTLISVSWRLKARRPLPHVCGSLVQSSYEGMQPCVPRLKWLRQQHKGLQPHTLVSFYFPYPAGYRLFQHKTTVPINRQPRGPDATPTSSLHFPVHPLSEGTLC